MLGALLPDAQLDVRLPERRLQLLDLVEQLPPARVRRRLAAPDQAGLAALEELPLPRRDRLLRRLPAPSGLRHAHLATDDCHDEPVLVFNRETEGRATCSSLHQEPDTNPTARFREAGQQDTLKPATIHQRGESAPSGIRTRATTLKGWRPGPLVDGGGRARIPAAGATIRGRPGG